MAVEEARLEEVGSGLAPVGPGWFVVNVAEAAWVRNDGFGGRCVFESNARVLQDRPGVERADVRGDRLHPRRARAGQADRMYQAESEQETVSSSRAGACCWSKRKSGRSVRGTSSTARPPGTRHTFVGTGDEPCVIFMTGARRENGTIVYPLSKTALSHGAGVETETPSPNEAYARF